MTKQSVSWLGYNRSWPLQVADLDDSDKRKPGPFAVIPSFLSFTPARRPWQPRWRCQHHTPQIALPRKTVAVAMCALPLAALCRRFAQMPSAGVRRRPISLCLFLAISIRPGTKGSAQRRGDSMPVKTESWRFWPTRSSLPRLSIHAPTCSMDRSCAPPPRDIQHRTAVKEKRPLR